jgi:hypothetical protein
MSLVINSSITFERITAIIATGDNRGLCITCAEEIDGVEPDSRGLECETCGTPTVFGAEEVLLIGWA